MGYQEIPMIALQVEESDNFGIVTLDGELTADRADELRVFLRWALGHVNHVALNMKNVTAVDVSCLQLLCTAHRMALMWKKRLTPDGGWTEPFRRAAEAAGASHCDECLADRERGCDWKRHFYGNSHG
jgi:ABC-type transporter Mla MlaB component